MKYFFFVVIVYSNFFLKKYPSRHNSGPNFSWTVESMCPLLNVFALTIEKDSGFLLLWDLFESYGSLLRACACLGWAYVGTCSSRKITVTSYAYVKELHRKCL